jgi:two-component system response regulator FixJ
MRSESRVCIVEDDEAIRESLRLLLFAAGIACHTYPSADTFLERADAREFDCLLLDIRMPGMSGLKLQEVLLERHIELPIIFITAHGDIPTAVDAVKRGAVEFIEKPFDDYRLLCLVLDALESDVRARGDRVARAELDARLSSLTRRERQVLDKMLTGRTSRVIAEELFVSDRTVEFHRRRIMHKLRAGSLGELFAMCLSGRARAPAPNPEPLEPHSH